MIRITDLDFGYTKKAALFQNLSLNLEPGKIHGILGKNGTGKSTLLKLISGGLTPKSGDVLINNMNKKHRSVKGLQQVFFLPEDLTVPSIKIKHFLATYAPFYPAFDYSKFYDILSSFQVPKESKLNQLSLGQKKKCMLAFGLASNCQYLLLDEPTNGLDIPSKSQFRKIIASTLRDEQTVLISTHQVRDLGKLLDTVVILDDGKIIFNQDIFSIENKLLFSKSIHDLTDKQNLYKENIMGGHIYISPNEHKDMTEAEIEVLFNAISVNREGILEQFKY